MITRAIVVFLVLFFAAMLAALVIQVMAVSVLAGTMLASVLVGALVLYAAYRLLATGKGVHRAPRGYAEADERLASTAERVIPRAVTENAPPWDPAPVTGPATEVIEPAVITHGPPPLPDAYWLAAGTYNRATGQARTVRVELLPPVEALLGHATTTAAVESMSAQWHSVESIFNGHHVRQVRKQLADGAS